MRTRGSGLLLGDGAPGVRLFLFLAFFDLVQVVLVADVVDEELTVEVIRFVLNRLREEMPYSEVPIRLVFSRRKRKSLSALKGGAAAEEA